ncbi:capsular polysaccharide synthesis protein [Acinetobacter sp. 3657]|uniref:glycosyltransferase family 32 protein n=1 Tax=Acinetobacter sp. 3657 TaxID=2817764 RepID=UPI0032B7E106
MKIFKKIFYLLKFYTMYSNEKREMNDAIDNYADIIVLNPINPNVVIPKKIWMYWEGDLPIIVEKCVEQLRSLHPSYEVFFLKPQDLIEFCTIDFESILYKKATPQQRSDLIRFNLLFLHGGIWLDASTIVYENLDWIQELIRKERTNCFAYYRKNNTTNMSYPVIETWLLASTQGNMFFKYWLEELWNAIELTPKGYIQNIADTQDNSHDLFQNIGRLEYLAVYVVCQKVMREYIPSMTLINCDKNAFFYQVKNRWVKERTLIDFAINYPPKQHPKLLKLAAKERKILNKFYAKNFYFKDSFLDI